MYAIRFFSHYPLRESLNKHGSENVAQIVNLLCLNHNHSPYFISFNWPNVHEFLCGWILKNGIYVQ